MIKPFRNAKFIQIFKSGMKAYIAGDWKKAKTEFELVQTSKGSPDFPTNSLLKVMQDYDFKAPSDWEGFRILTEK